MDKLAEALEYISINQDFKLHYISFSGTYIMDFLIHYNDLSGKYDYILRYGGNKPEVSKMNARNFLIESQKDFSICVIKISNSNCIEDLVDEVDFLRINFIKYNIVNNRSH